MVLHSGRSFRFLGTMAAICLISVAAQAAGASANLQGFVQENIDRGYALLNNDSISDAQRSSQFRSFMLSLMDTSRIGAFTLGPYANSASPADLADFEKAFS